MRNIVTREVRKAKYNHEIKVSRDSTNNAKHSWAYLRSKTNVKEMISKIRTSTGEITDDDQGIAQQMNAAFNRVFVREDTSQPPSAPNLIQGPNVSDVTLFREDIETRLRGLKENTSPGPDGVLPIVLRTCADILSIPLLVILQSSVDFSEVPRDWRNANISPIYEKCSKTNPLNYRPVSLTNIVSKLLESIIREVIVKHLSDNNLISDAEHGFRRSRSCLTNMLTYIDDLINAVDSGYSFDINYLGCEKVFDRVPHVRLILKL